MSDPGFVVGVANGSVANLNDDLQRMPEGLAYRRLVSVLVPIMQRESLSPAEILQELTTRINDIGIGADGLLHRLAEAALTMLVETSAVLDAVRSTQQATMISSDVEDGRRGHMGAARVQCRQEFTTALEDAFTRLCDDAQARLSFPERAAYLAELGRCLLASVAAIGRSAELPTAEGKSR